MAERREKAQNALEVITIAAVFILCSAGLIAFNKYLMHKDRFPHAMFLTAGHMGMSTFMSLLLLGVAPQLFPTLKKARARWSDVFLGVGPIGILFATSLYCSNRAYLYCSIAFLQFCKEINVGIIFVMSVIVGLQTFSWYKVAILSVVFSGGYVSITGDLNFSMVGFMLQISSELCACSKSVLSELLMSRDLKLDPLTFILFMAPFSFLPLCAGAYLQWTPEVLSDFYNVWPLLLVNAFLAFLLNMIIAFAIKRISSLALVIVGITKDVAIVAVSPFVFGDTITVTQLCGFLVTLIGIAWWSHMKMQEVESKAESAPLLPLPAQKQAADKSASG